MSQYAWTTAVLTDRATWPRAASTMSMTRDRRTSSGLALAGPTATTGFLRGVFVTTAIYSPDRRGKSGAVSTIQVL
jgi:hypothetical protein